jgi:phosphatidylglycerol:prolipoprotein diacylglycerol transferase
MRRRGLAPDELWSLVFLLAAGVVAGSYLFYALFYNGGPAGNLPFLLKYKRLPGGSFWGGFWTALVCAYIYCRAERIDFRRVADAVGLSAILALAVMRLGCFQHGCCYGTPTALRWGVVYTDPRCAVDGSLLGKALHPSQLYESLGCLAALLIIYLVFLKRERLKPGGAFVLAVVFYSMLRFAVDFFRGGDSGILQAGRLTTAQLISLAGAAASVLWYRRAENL